MQTESGELFQNDVLHFEDEQNVENDDYLRGNVQPTIKLPAQRRCFSHLLNLASADFQKNLPNLASKAFMQTYNKLNALWHTTNRSSYAKSICRKELNCSLKIPCDTRWNSKFDSIKKILEICKSEPSFERNKINGLIRRLKSELYAAGHLSPLTQNDLSVIETYVQIMEPLAFALDKLQGEYNCSQGYILPVLISMKLRISSIETRDSNILEDFKVTMLQVSCWLSCY